VPRTSRTAPSARWVITSPTVHCCWTTAPSTRRRQRPSGTSSETTACSKGVALEYIVFKADWEAAGHASPPVLFGRQFDFTAAPNRYGLPPFYSLHAWIWKPNPSGLLFAWNPDVNCVG